MTPVGKGITLGLLNTFVVALGLAVAITDPPVQVFPVVVILGFIPGAVIGGIAGSLAGSLASRSVWIRVPILALLPIAFVLGMGRIDPMFEYAGGACIPTLVAVLILERSTRSNDAPPVPIARLF